MIKVAMLSYWHVHAWDYTKQVQAHPDTEIAYVWDELPERGRDVAAKLGVPFVADLDELLGRDDYKAVVVDAPTNMHRDVMVKAALRGKHIFTEKVIAPTVREVDEILAAVEKTGVKLTVSLPRLNDRSTLAMQAVVEQGLLGPVTQVRARLSHNGATAGWLPEHFYHLEQCGGGALIDLGCHPMYVTRLLMGMPTQVSATYGYVTGKQVEDNAVSVLTGADGAIGIVEAGFVNSHSPFTVEVHGVDGSLLFGTPDGQIMVRSNKLDKEGWVEMPQGDGRISAFEQWVDHIQKDTVAEDNIRIARDLTALMEASNRSVMEGRVIRIAELG